MVCLVSYVEYLGLGWFTGGQGEVKTRRRKILLLFGALMISVGGMGVIVEMRGGTWKAIVSRHHSGLLREGPVCL